MGLAAIEEKRTMYEISQKNDHATLDILRSLEQMEESVTNKKLEQSTIEELNIDWKKHRRLEKKQKEKAKDKNKNKKQSSNGRQINLRKSGKGKDKEKNKAKGRGRGRRRGRGRKAKLKPFVVSDNDIDFDLDDESEDAFAHLRNDNSAKQAVKEETDDKIENIAIPPTVQVPVVASNANMESIAQNDNAEVKIKTDDREIDMDLQESIQVLPTHIVDEENKDNDDKNNDDEPSNETDALLARLDCFADFLSKGN